MSEAETDDFLKAFARTIAGERIRDSVLATLFRLGVTDRLNEDMETRLSKELLVSIRQELFEEEKKI